MSSTQTEHKKKILVADDEGIIRGIVKELLTPAGYDILEASDGEEALKLTHSERPDLIVLDLVMPKITGFDVIREIRKDRRIRNTPILIVSGVVHGQASNELLRSYEIAGFIAKPNMIKTLLSRVQEILSKQTEVPPPRSVHS